jgi:hypothetical protein
MNPNMNCIIDNHYNEDILDSVIESKEYPQQI